MINSYKDLTVWQKAVELCVLVYQATQTFPKSELFGLTSQIRRSAVSIPSNIAEGQMRGHKQEYVQFLRVAYASGGELETQLLVSLRVGFLNNDSYRRLSLNLEEVLKMLNKLISVLSRT